MQANTPNPIPSTYADDPPLAPLSSKLPQFFLVLLLWLTALAVPYQVYLYRVDFKNYYKLKSQQETLNIEYNQLLLEQQTFGSTPTIGTRALNLGMIAPPANKIITLSIAPPSSNSVTTATPKPQPAEPAHE